MFRKYQRTQIAELRPYIPGESMADISISSPDLENGSPKLGDMIARNPKNHEDQWLVAEQYFKDNFTPIDAALEAQLAARTGGDKHLLVALNKTGGMRAEMRLDDLPNIHDVIDTLNEWAESDPSRRLAIVPSAALKAAMEAKE